MVFHQAKHPALAFSVVRVIFWNRIWYSVTAVPERGSACSHSILQEIYILVIQIRIYTPILSSRNCCIQPKLKFLEPFGSEPSQQCCSSAAIMVLLQLLLVLALCGMIQVQFQLCCFRSFSFSFSQLTKNDAKFTIFILVLVV